MIDRLRAITGKRTAPGTWERHWFAHNSDTDAAAIVAMDHTYEALLAVASEGRAYRDLVFASASESDQLEAWARFDDALAALDARIAEVTK